MAGGRIALVRAVVGGALVVASLGACRGIAGLRDLTYVAPPTPCSAPSLPTEGSGRVRLVNASTAGTADFCIRASGTASWGNPVLTGGGPSCPSGLEYAQATLPFAVPGGSVDVEVVAAGAPCDSTPSAQLASVAVGSTGAEAGSDGSSPVMTLVFFGKSGAGRLVALPEEPPSPTQVYQERLRIIDALSSGEDVQVGIASRGSLPATVANAGIDVPSGSVPAQQGPIAGIVTGIDANGYVSTEPLALNFGVVLSGQTGALFLVTTPENGDTQTLLALGDTGDPLHRARGLLCDDAVVPVDADAGGAQGASTVLAPCQLTTLPDLTVDTVNVSLYGAAAPFWRDREPVLPGVLAARTSDLLCIVEADSDTDKQAIADAYQNAQGGYAYTPSLTLQTPPNDPTTADGGAPGALGIPCSGVSADLVDASYACMAQCATPPDSTGAIGQPSCLTDNCAGSLGAMYFASAADNACFDCILFYAVSEQPLAAGMTACTTSSVQPFAFDGMGTSMILSRYPFAAPPQTYVLPSTGFRRAVLYAPIQLEDQVVDFYCAQLSSPLIDDELPYTGSYGSDTGLLPDGGTTKTNGYEEEQDLQVQQVIRFVTATSAQSGHPAILAGDWHAGLAASTAAPDGGTQQVLTDLSPEVPRALDQQYGGPFVRAEPPGYSPVCEFCPAPANYYNTGDSPSDLTTTYLLGFAPGSTTDDSIWGTSNEAVTLTASQYESLPAASSDGKGPLYEYWPRTVSVLRPIVKP